jgi:predicted nucleotidyltransferase
MNRYRDMAHTAKRFNSAQAEQETILNTVQRALEAQPSVVFAYVLGSFLEDLPFHDIDVAVYLDVADEREMSRLALDLAAGLEKVLPRVPLGPSPTLGGKKDADRKYERTVVRLPVDVRVLNRAPPRFRYHVFRGKLLFSRDETLRTQWVERTMRHYLDLKPLRQRALKEAMTA